MITAAYLAVALLIFGVATWLHYRFWVRRFEAPLTYAAEERVTTGDGLDVVLRRVFAATETPRGPPVVMVHGIALNHRNHDLSEEISLSRHLARAGRDVWLLTLRSGREDLRWSEERRVTFQAMVEHDLPAAIEAVRARAGAPHVDYVGFSMGGMLMYAAYGRSVSPEALRRVVIIGSPARVTLRFAFVAVLAKFIPGWIVPTLRLRLLGRLIAFVADRGPTPIHHLLYNPENVDVGFASRTLVNGVVNVGGRLGAQFVAWAASGEPVAMPGEATPIIDGLRPARTPVLFVAGARDHLAPPATVRLAHDAWGADAVGFGDKRFLLASLDAGHAADYGHGDLVLGRYADQDVFDPVAEFLEAGIEG